MTIINRRTFVAERGKFQEAIDLLQGATKTARYKYRICSCYYGAFDATTTALQPYQGVAHSQLAAYDFVSRLCEIAAPALIVVGTSDGVSSLSQSQRLQLGLAHSKLLVIEKAGHSPWLEQPEALFSGFRRFCRRWDMHLICKTGGTWIDILRPHILQLGSSW